jgi:hypothetical protein
MGHTVAERSWKDADFVYSLYSAWRLWKSVVTLAVHGILFPVEFLALEGANVNEASIAVDLKSMGHTVAKRSWKDADFVCISCI